MAPHSSILAREIPRTEKPGGLQSMRWQRVGLLLLLLSRFSHVWLYATPQMAAHQAPPFLGFFREEHWNELPFPSPNMQSTYRFTDILSPTILHLLESFLSIMLQKIMNQSISQGRTLLLLLSHFSCVRLCVTPQTAAHQAPPGPQDSPGKNTGVDCHFLVQCIKIKSESEVAQSCPTLSDPMDCSLPGSSIHGIFQARVLEWDAIAFSKGRIVALANIRLKSILTIFLFSE